MSETIATCITQIITALITVGVTILVAYKTYRSQKSKEDMEIRRLQTINRNSSLELFLAYIANLILFASPTEIDLDSKTLCICLEK